ncbi:MAG: 23S rRNA (uracil(1939)-C(5))-methyltransferase RlmD [Firmicutes bacterium]|jgi:23S rRNA (uracil1939-C5)-methyltransferase|nr:23S rRNA (uracil(1939)-C(5))-methyltransferase RlmD [Bacillota bacterium]
MANSIKVHIDRMGQHGEGVARDDEGRVVFVAGALPGENVEAVVTEVRKNFSRARVIERLYSSPARITPRCPIFDQCGGCAFQHWEYREELAYKEDRVRQALLRIAEIPNPVVDPIVGMADPYGYRNKGQFPWGGVPGQAFLGLYARGTHRVVAADHCDIQDVKINGLLLQIKAMANELALPPYDEGTGHGVLRHLLLRSSGQEQRILALLVVSRWDDRLQQLADRMVANLPQLAGVGANFNEVRTNRVLGAETRLLAGQQNIHEKILGKSFVVSFESFFQVNPVQVETLYRLAIGAIPDHTRVVWDLYAGVGTLAILASERAAQVKALEVNRQAVLDADANIAENGITNVVMVLGQAEKVIPVWAAHDQEMPGAVILDPPRAGLFPDVINALNKVHVNRLIYVSCNPDTLARDIGLLKQHYQLMRVTPVDMFPRTDHVEAVAILDASFAVGIRGMGQ